MERPTKKTVRLIAIFIAITCLAVILVWVSVAIEGVQRSERSSTPSVLPAEASAPEETQVQQEASVTITPKPTPEPVVIQPGKVTELYIPSDNPSLVINTGVLQMPSDCKSVIEPPIGTPDQGEVFQCGDFAMPSTSTDQNVLLAGHSSHGLDTVFNRLYPQGESMVDRQVFLRTTTSNEQWLEYRVSAVYEPSKPDLPYMGEVWEPTPGRLILVTCLQEDGLWSSERNFIVIADFVGVQETL